MTREIKFRAWDKEKGMKHSPMPGFDGEYVDINEMLRCMQINDKQLMQFTGLLDKNGKEIYEGDVLRCERSYWDNPRNLIVEWFGERYGLRNPKDNVDSEVMDRESSFDVSEYEREVIGNIYENIDLIK